MPLLDPHELNKSLSHVVAMRSHLIGESPGTDWGHYKESLEAVSQQIMDSFICPFDQLYKIVRHLCDATSVYGEIGLFGTELIDNSDMIPMVHLARDSTLREMRIELNLGTVFAIGEIANMFAEDVNANAELLRSSINMLREFHDRTLAVESKTVSPMMEPRELGLPGRPFRYRKLYPGLPLPRFKSVSNSASTGELRAALFHAMQVSILAHEWGHAWFASNERSNNTYNLHPRLHEFLVANEDKIGPELLALCSEEWEEELIADDLAMRIALPYFFEHYQRVFSNVRGVSDIVTHFCPATLKGEARHAFGPEAQGVFLCWCGFALSIHGMTAFGAKKASHPPAMLRLMYIEYGLITELRVHGLSKYTSTIRDIFMSK